MSGGPGVVNGRSIGVRGIVCKPRGGQAEGGGIDVCKAAPTDGGGLGHCIISLGRGDVSPSGNVDRGNANPARVGGFGLKRNPERVEALFDAVNGQGEVRWVKVAETILQPLNG